MTEEELFWEYPFFSTPQTPDEYFPVFNWIWRKEHNFNDEKFRGDDYKILVGSEDSFFYYMVLDVWHTFVCKHALSTEDRKKINWFPHAFEIYQELVLPIDSWVAFDKYADPTTQEKYSYELIERTINYASKGKFAFANWMLTLINNFMPYQIAVAKGIYNKAKEIITNQRTLEMFYYAFGVASNIYKRTLFGLMAEGINIFQHQKKLGLNIIDPTMPDITKDEVLAYYQNEAIAEAFLKEVQKVLRDNTQKQKEWFDRGYYGNAREVYAEAEKRGWLTIVDDYKMEWHKPKTWLAYLILQIYSPEGIPKQRIENSFVEAVFDIKRLDAIIANRLRLKTSRERAWEAEINALAMVGRKPKLIL